MVLPASGVAARLTGGAADVNAGAESFVDVVEGLTAASTIEGFLWM